MLVYANHLAFSGETAERAVLKGIGAWLKEQLGFGLHPDQIVREGEYNGWRVLDDMPTWVRVYAAGEAEPRLYAWTLKCQDTVVRGRQWITELGLKVLDNTFEFSCIVKTDEQSALVAAPVTASRPRVIPYVVQNIRESRGAQFASTVPGQSLKTVGQDRYSYRALLIEIERITRTCPLVLISPNADGHYLVDAVRLQRDLFGLADVVQISTDFDSFAMEEVLGRRWSAWDGAVNVVHVPTKNGQIYNHLFLSRVIEEWGPTQNARIAHLLAWVTSNTNIPHLQRRIRIEGVTQLSLRRRLKAAGADSTLADTNKLRQELGDTLRLLDEQGEWTLVVEDDNERLNADNKNLRAALEDMQGEMERGQYTIRSLKDQLTASNTDRTGDIDTIRERLLKLSIGMPTPVECLEAIQDVYGSNCTVLGSAISSARDVRRFEYGRRLLDLLIRLVTEYRKNLIQGGDDAARKVFASSEFAAKESETVTGNKALRRYRTFPYGDGEVEMLRHLRIGIEDDPTKTIRVHFHWDAQRGKIVIGYCGEHLPL